MAEPRPRDCAAAARALYSEGPLLLRVLQRWRPYICPFHRLIGLVPERSRVLDVGCGGGLFLALLAWFGRLRAGYGFDVSASAIAVANRMRARLPDRAALQFQHVDARAPWPEGTYDVVSLIDVLHHIPPRHQKAIILQGAQHVPAGGRLLYKDMAQDPRWSSTANHLHDLVMAREWIHLVPFPTVTAWLDGAGFELETAGSERMLWYTHEWGVFRRV